MDLKLADKRAFISGSSKGIGLAIATALAREGARVVINGRTEASVSAALSEVLGAVPKATIEGFVGDLATPQAAELLGTKFPSVDVMGGLYLGVAVTGVEALVAMGLVIAFM